MAESRKLAAILASDVVGYSRLVGTDEDRTLAQLRALRSDLIDPIMAVHHGRVVKRVGDGSIIEFRSVVDAVRYAIEVQNGMIKRNAGVLPEQRIELRIGIHLGDVVEESDGDLMGDGVNIATRLEGICEPNGICLSEDAYRQVRDRMKEEFIDLGERELKNIARPVRAYAVKRAGPSTTPAPAPSPLGKSAPSPAAPQRWSTGGRGRRIAIALLLLALAGGGAAAYYFYFTYAPVVKVATVISAPASEVVYGSGTVEPVEWAKVVPLQRRRLVSLCRCEGLEVKQNQVLGQQDDAEERSVLNELQTRHQQLVRDLDRAETDHKDKKISDSELEQRQTAVQESHDRIDAQNARLETLVLRSPLDGMVLRRDGEIGEIVGPTDVLFWIGKPSPLQVVAEIDEEEITKIRTGQIAFLANEAFPGRTLRATVKQITPQGDPTKKTFRVYLQLPPDSPLRIGMTVELNIVFREKAAATLVPNEAVANGAVEVVSGGQIHKVPVSLGIHGSRAVEVIGNVSPGALVVSPARLDLADGRRVRTAEPAKLIPDALPAGATPGTAAETNSDVNSNLAAGPQGLAERSLDQAISGALSARILSIVSDARRAASQPAAPR